MTDLRLLCAVAVWLPFAMQAHVWSAGDTLLEDRIAFLLGMLSVTALLRLAGSSGEVLLSAVMVTAAGVLAALDGNTFAFRVAAGISQTIMVIAWGETALVQPKYTRRRAVAWAAFAAALFGLALYMLVNFALDEGDPWGTHARSITARVLGTSLVEPVLTFVLLISVAWIATGQRRA